MTLNEYQQQALRTTGELQPFQMIVNGCMGLNGEAGECIDILKKHLFQGHSLDAGKLVEELGDCLWYIAHAASGLGFDLDLVAERNIAKLEKRYPEGFDPERSRNREEDAS